MIIIDGSEGEAGGQIIRSSLALSAITQKPFTITKIRAKRPQPGLKEQHLQTVNAIAQLCNAEITGNKLHSQELTFIPHTLKPGHLNIKINTAGSIGLVLQSLLIATVKTDLEIMIQGGATWGKWAPPVLFLEEILLPLLEKMNYFVKIKRKKEGFYPKGGALVEVKANKAELSTLTLTERTPIEEIKIISLAEKSLEGKKVAERQAKEAQKLIFTKFKLDPNIKKEYCSALNPGSGLLLVLKTKNSVIGADSLGEKGKTSEKVAQEACSKLIENYENGVVDEHIADMLLPYLALAGFGKIKVSKVSDHVKTNISVIEKFLPVRFEIENNIITCFSSKIKE
ncbi:RNA 3'-terminal phosphate cyclase [Candidatus Woesearchaeota archaeon]|nr:RNA 3'-terminal phosphate cyclase [Candidatus Woesearchaeota archaeon]